MRSIVLEGCIITTLCFLSALHEDVFGSSEIHAVTNVALGKVTLQSTLSKYQSSLAVDGNTDQYVANGSCINIEKKGESWWQVDLGDIYSIFSVRIYHSKDCCDVVVEDCYKDPMTYRGKANTTVSGITCLSWSMKHPLSDYHLSSRYVNAIDGENYCRTPSRRYYCSWNYLAKYPSFCESIKRVDKPWCFTTDPEILWEYCDVEKCENVKTDDINLLTGPTENNMVAPDYVETSDTSRKIRDFATYGIPRARYIELHQDGTLDYFPLCEVEVYGTQDDMINIAFQKPTELSSLSKEYHAQQGGVDGKLTTCFHSLQEENPWWRVDLRGIYVIYVVRLYNRQECCRDRAHDILLQLGMSLDAMTNVSFVEGQIQDIQDFILPNITNTKCKHNPCENEGICYLRHCSDKNCRNLMCACKEGYGGVNCELETSNVAAGKRIKASSIQHKNWKPVNAIDGNNNQNVLEGATCVSTQRELKPYVIIDLDDKYSLTQVKVYKRSDCCPDEEYDFELYLMKDEWVNEGYTYGVNKETFLFYPYVMTRSLKITTKVEEPVLLQLCEIEIYANFLEEITSSNASSLSSRETKQQNTKYIQMRFSFSDKYTDVVKSESSFINSIRQGLSLQTGYSVKSFQYLQLEKDPFRVSLQLHASEGNETLDEKFKKIDTMIRFGILEIEDNDGDHPILVTAGSLQHHVMYTENKGTKTSSMTKALAMIFATVSAYYL